MGFESLAEGLAIALACGSLLLLSRVFAWGVFARGATAAGIALGACWTIIAFFLLTMGDVPRLGLLLLVVFPALEEAVRATFIYAILPRPPHLRKSILPFAGGYAAVEPIYKAALSVWLIAETGSEVGLSNLLIDLVLPGSALLLLGLLMLALRTIGLPAPAAWLICSLLHSAHNISVQMFLVPSPNYLVTGLLMFAGYAAASLAVFQLIGRGGDASTAEGAP